MSVFRKIYTKSVGLDESRSSGSTNGSIAQQQEYSELFLAKERTSQWSHMFSYYQRPVLPGCYELARDQTCIQLKERSGISVIPNNVFAMSNSYSSSCSTSSKRETGYSTDTMLSPPKNKKTRCCLEFTTSISKNRPDNQDKYLQYTKIIEIDPNLEENSHLISSSKILNRSRNTSGKRRSSSRKSALSSSPNNNHSKIELNLPQILMSNQYSFQSLLENSSDHESSQKNSIDNTDACSTISNVSNISSISVGSSNCSNNSSTVSTLPKLKLEIPVLPAVADNLKSFNCEFIAPNEKFEIGRDDVDQCDMSDNEDQQSCYHMLRCRFSAEQMKNKMQKKLYIEKSSKAMVSQYF